MDRANFRCPRDIAIAVSISSCATFLIALAIVYIFRLDIQILLFEHFNIRPFYGAKDKRTDFNTDAYLLYNDKDEHFAEVLLKDLEKEGYQVYCPAADPNYGRCSVEVRSEKLDQTHRVLVVLSQAFVDSEESMRQFVHANEHRDSSTIRDRFFVFISLDQNINIGENSILKSYIRTRTYIQFKNNYKRLMTILRYWLPNPVQLPTAPRHDSQQGGPVVLGNDRRGPHLVQVEGSEESQPLIDLEESC